MLGKFLIYAQANLGFCFLILFAFLIALRFLLPVVLFIIIGAVGIIIMSVLALINYFSQNTKP